MLKVMQVDANIQALAVKHWQSDDDHIQYNNQNQYKSDNERK